MNDIRPLPMAIAMGAGAIVGFVIWMATDLFVFLPVFIAAGLPIGLAAAQNRD